MTPTGVASPCMDVCAMDAASGWCSGCLRTLDEIALWSQLDDDDKRAVWALLDARRARFQPRQPSLAHPVANPLAKAVDA